ncbi:unnamed protein product [Ixodes hexagonus]
MDRTRWHCSDTPSGMARSEIVIPIHSLRSVPQESYRTEVKRHVQEVLERASRPNYDLRRELSAMFNQFPMRSSLLEDDDFDDFFRDIVPARSFPSFEKAFKEVKTVVDENNKLLMEVDVHEYEPEEITVKAIEGKLMVHCKKQRPGSCKETRREISLPDGIDVETITSSLTADGNLKITAMLPMPEQDRLQQATAEPEGDQKAEAFLYVGDY